MKPLQTPQNTPNLAPVRGVFVPDDKYIIGVIIGLLYQATLTEYWVRGENGVSVEEITAIFEIVMEGFLE